MAFQGLKSSDWRIEPGDCVPTGQREGLARSRRVVDQQTDREVERARGAYEEQLRLYARAVREATGEGSDGMLLVL